MEKTALRKLLSGDLPEMVRWYKLRLLARVWVRTIVSNVFGQYADQRLLQAATDKVDKATLASRYDYSDLSSPDPDRRLKRDATGGVWLDYVADTGDGFASTYAMSYLLALEQIDLKEAGVLPRGEILIFGGDQAYPQATREEYENRFILPLKWAHTSDQNVRKAFAIPGNHDWYDGLTAFDGLFCSARGDLADGEGETIGGWQFKQHRSYWALKLPYNWWIWGADIQFSKYLDNAQVNYFEAIAEHMGPDDNLVICLAQPAWLLADQHGIDDEENLFKLATIARHHGANISAVIAGDWHHYNRYHASELGTHFFTAGGGGAFMHATHVLKDDISVTWPERPHEEGDQPTDAVPTGRRAAAGGKGVGAKGELWKTKKVDLGLRDHRKRMKNKAPRDPAARRAEAKDIIEHGGTPSRDVGGAAGVGPDGQQVPVNVRTSERAPKCYPSKRVSRWLSLRNLWFPISNLGFAAGIGVIYWLVTWSFHVVAKDVKSVTVIPFDKLSFGGIMSTLDILPGILTRALLFGPGFLLLLAAMTAVLVWYVHSTSKRGIWRWVVKLSVGLAHSLVHTAAMFAIFLLLMTINNSIAHKITPMVEGYLNTEVAEQQGKIDEFVRETLTPLSKQGMERRDYIEQKLDADPQTRSMVPPSGLPELKPLTGTKIKITLNAKQVRNFVGLLYPIEMILLGGLVGGFIWGAYWVLAGLIGKMHAEDAFAALGIKNHKNFLRMKLTPDALTIYPIGLDKVPGQSGWVNAPPGGSTYVNQPKLIASPPLKPELIEEPIVIPARRNGPLVG